MRANSRTVLLRSLATALLTGTLGGCGGSAPKVEAVNEQVIFTSAADCTASGKLKPEQCTKAIEEAMDTHLKTSPIYKTLALCEGAEGQEHCERMNEKTYRPRLAAISVPIASAVAAETTGEPLGATPLYPTLSQELGFRTLDKRILLSDTELLTFSPQALAAAELNASQGSKKEAGGFF